jgi:hypothetical protein
MKFNIKIPQDVLEGFFYSYNVQIAVLLKVIRNFRNNLIGKKQLQT